MNMDRLVAECDSIHITGKFEIYSRLGNSI